MLHKVTFCYPQSSNQKLKINIFQKKKIKKNTSKFINKLIAQSTFLLPKIPKINIFHKCQKKIHFKIQVNFFYPKSSKSIFSLNTNKHLSRNRFREIKTKTFSPQKQPSPLIPSPVVHHLMEIEVRELETHFKFYFYDQ